MDHCSARGQHVLKLAKFQQIWSTKIIKRGNGYGQGQVDRFYGCYSRYHHDYSGFGVEGTGDPQFARIVGAERQLFGLYTFLLLAWDDVDRLAQWMVGRKKNIHTGHLVQPVHPLLLIALSLCDEDCQQSFRWFLCPRAVWRHRSADHFKQYLIEQFAGESECWKWGAQDKNFLPEKVADHRSADKRHWLHYRHYRLSACGDDQCSVGCGISGPARAHERGRTSVRIALPDYQEVFFSFYNLNLVAAIWKEQPI